MVLTFESTEQVVLRELTVSWEDRVEEAKKRANYSEVTTEGRSNDWRSRCEPVEVGYRGFAGFLHQVFKLFAVKGNQREPRRTSSMLQRRPHGRCGSVGGSVEQFTACTQDED